MKKLLLTFFSVMKTLFENNFSDGEVPSKIGRFVKFFKNLNDLSERPMLCVNRTEIFFSIERG